LDESQTTVTLSDLEMSNTITLETLKSSWLDTIMSNKTLEEVEVDRPLPDLPEDGEDEYI
jgi:hypothetical protein